MLLTKIARYYHTVKYLKRSQVSGRLSYRIKRKLTDYQKYYRQSEVNPSLRKINLVEPINRYESFKAPTTFTFVNLKQTFINEIDWNFKKYGKLWTYNLNYFDFINQSEITKENALQLIRDYVNAESEIIDGKEPYPISLRVINWLKFLSINKVDDFSINQFILGDLNNLEDNLEFHLLGNHLLENAFALTIGGYCLNHQQFFQKGKKLLLEQLSIQICEDGGHYELSPMYHQILLDRLLDTINFLGQDSEELFVYAKKMLSWLDNITFANGEIPLVNDSAPGIAPKTKDLLSYAKRLGIHFETITLKDSGYRLFTQKQYECIVDGGSLGPDYHTGHGHNDAGSFLLHIDGKSIITDTGISTYEENERRLDEKSVISHNTVHPKGIEPSEMWKSFRVGRREKVKIMQENEHSILIQRVLPYKHDIDLKREFIFRDSVITIKDTVNASGSLRDNYAYLHFDPKLKVCLKGNTVYTSLAEFNFKSAKSLQINKTLVADGFNSFIESNKLTIIFEEKLQTTININ